MFPIISNSQMMETFGDCSDAESVVDSIIDSLNSPGSPGSLDEWCERALSDFSMENKFADALFTGTQEMDYGYNFDNNVPPLNLPLQQFNQTEMILNNTHTTPLATQQHQSYNPIPIYSNDYQNTNDLGMIYEQQQQQQQQQNVLYNRMDSQISNEGSIDELFQQQFNFLRKINQSDNTLQRQQQQQSQQHQQRQQQQRQQHQAELFNINQTTINKFKTNQFLNMIKQQQKADMASIQSSPPQTPYSDWSDIPSPCSPMSRSCFVKSEMEKKDSCLLKSVEMKLNTLNERINLPDSLKPVSSTNIKKESIPVKPKRKRSNRKQYTTNSGKPRLYKFLREILDDPSTYTCIEWVDKASGTFKFLDSSEVARLWGFRKNKPSMKYENFARSLRTYIAKGILKKPRNKLVYCFAHPATESTD